MAQQDRIGNHMTHIYTIGNQTRVKYHSTDVVRFSDKHITLDTGNWWTVTTKLRMNQASRQFNLGYHVYQKDWTWYVDFKGKTIPFDRITLRLVR